MAKCKVGERCNLSPRGCSKLQAMAVTRIIRNVFLLTLSLASLLFAPRLVAQIPSAVLSADGTSATAPHLAVALVSSAATIAPGAGFQTGLHFKLEDGWHVYWINAGDAGEAPTIAWTLPKGITAGPMQFPVPQRLPLGPLMDYGYQNEVVFPMDMEVAPAFKPGAPVTLAAKVEWQVCREVCLPGKAMLALKLPTGMAPGVNQAGLALIQTWNNKLPKALPGNDAVAYGTQVEPFHIMVHTSHASAGAQFFPLDQDQISNPSPQRVTATKYGFALDVKKDDSLKTPPDVLNGLLVFGDGTAYEIHAKHSALGYVSSVPSPAVKETGLLNALGLAFIGGIILNLMPCVFPVLFIKALSLVQSSREARREMRLHGLVYTLGILVSFWAVVALLLVLRGAGRHLGWGFQFQSPGFLAVMALLLFFLGLSLAGMFEIGLRLTSAGGSLAEKGGYSGSFFTGVLAMVVATPCTAPFMGAAIGYALAQSAWVSFLVFTALGIGLALPYLLLAFQPAWTKLMPRPGAWMEVLKQATAVPIFATVIWLVWLFTSSTSANALAFLLLAFLLLGVAGWILGRWPAKTLPTMAAGLIILAAIVVPLVAMRMTAFFVPTAAGSGAKVMVFDPKSWQPFTPTVVASYQAQGRPVLVDFTANWCLSCQVNERVVLDRPEVQARLRASNIALIRADWTHHDDDIAQALSALGRSGVPAYAVYPSTPGGTPVLLPEVLTSSILFDAVDKVARPAGASSAVASNLAGVTLK
jgi:thiol:disulfide interchange protein/DsbC/DsbD-like thiol-disulfide interchange protein